MSRAPRIDTLRNRLQATRELLAITEDELEDLHVLAYERHHNQREKIRVHGGQRDYALDTHGDPKARDAYRLLGGKAIEACDKLAAAAHGAIRLLRDGEPTGARTRRTITADELYQSVEAQARRIHNGDYVPVRTQPQPDEANVVRRLRAERDQARAEIKRLERTVERMIRDRNQEAS